MAGFDSRSGAFAGSHNIQAKLSDDNAFELPMEIYNVDGNVLQGAGPTVPADGTAGYLPGCQWQHTDGSGVNDLFYVNIGDENSCNFNPVAVTADGGGGGSAPASSSSSAAAEAAAAESSSSSSSA